MIWFHFIIHAWYGGEQSLDVPTLQYGVPVCIPPSYSEYCRIVLDPVFNSHRWRIDHLNGILRTLYRVNSRSTDP